MAPIFGMKARGTWQSEQMARTPAVFLPCTLFTYSGSMLSFISWQDVQNVKLFV